MAKKQKNKFAPNIPTPSSPREMPVLLARTLEQSQKDVEFKQYLPNESKEPMLLSEIKNGLNEEQLVQFELFKAQYQTALNSLKELYFLNQNTQKEFEQKFADLEKDKQSLADDKQDFENRKSEQEQQIINQQKQLEKDKNNQEQEFADKRERLLNEQKRLDENKTNFHIEQQNFNQELTKRNAEISHKLAKIAEQERDLLVREADAQNNFSQLNQGVLLALKNEIANLQNQQLAEQNKLTQIQAEIIEKQRLADEELWQKEQEFLQEKQNVANEKSKLARDKRRLDDEFRELKSQQAEIREAIEQEFAREIDKLKQGIERLSDKLQTSYDENDDLQTQLNEFVDFREVLARLNQSPNDLVYELQQKNQEIIDLKAQLNNSNDETLRGQLNFYQNENRGLKNQNDELVLDLSAKNKELSQLKLGIADKETLMTEKRVLEKQKSILELRLQELSKTIDDLMDSQLAETPFPQMKALDEIKGRDIEWAEIASLEQFATELQHRIAQAEKGKKLYFRLNDIRLLLAGLAMSQLHIFQGISGTGKTSLAKAFAKAVGGFCTDISVQAGWRDRDDLLGHYNAFEKKFYEKDCLQGLYRAGTETFGEHIHIILLDEMNLSRPEQYFAEFLSALEKNDVNDRVISLSESELPNAPKYLKEGRKIQVPRNVWFIGTANHDETTNEFADKTYDRAFVMNLPRNEETFEITPFEQANFGVNALQKLFKKAEKEHKEITKSLLDDLKNHDLTLLLEDNFGLGWGNRFEAQALRFIPVFKACGGSELMALDHLLASRMLRQGKVTGRYDVSPQDITELKEALDDFGNQHKGKLVQSIKLLDDDLKCKERGL